MSYKIKYIYDTGDSFNTNYEVEDVLELEWNKLKVAKANLKRIEEHYKQYTDCHTSYTKKSNQEILEENVHKDWFVNKPILVCYKDDITNYSAIDESFKQKALYRGYLINYLIDVTAATYQIILYTDDNKPWQIWAPCCGYFETLISIEVIGKALDTKIKFR